MTLNEIIELAERLSPDEKRRLIDHLTAADPADEDFPLTDAQKRLLDQRLAEHAANPDDGISLDQWRATYLRGE